MLKKFLSIITSLLVALSILPQSIVVNAEEEWTNPPRIYVSSAYDNASTVTVTVDIGACEDLSYLGFYLHYDSSKLSFAEYTEGDALGEKADVYAESGEIQYAGSANDPITIDKRSNLITFSFSVIDGADGDCGIYADEFEMIEVIDGLDLDDMLYYTANFSGSERNTKEVPESQVILPTKLVEIEVEAPKKGSTPATTVTTSKGTASIEWPRGDAIFKASTSYAAEITIQGGDSVRFADDVTVKVNGETWKASVSGNTVTVAVKFPETAAKELTGIAPSATSTSVEVGSSYKDVSNKVKVTASYDDGTEAELIYGAYTASVESFPEKGTEEVTLTYTEDGVTKTSAVTVTVTGKQANASYDGETSIEYDGQDKLNSIKENVTVDGADAEHGEVTVTVKDSDGKPVTEVKEAGTYKIFFRLSGSGTVYEGPTDDTEIGKVTIERADGSKAEVTVSEETYTYDKQEKKPDVTVKINGAEVSDSEYNVSYENNVNAGKATVKVEFTKNYKNSATGEFTIEKKPLDLKTAFFDKQEKEYDGTTSSDLTSVTVTDDDETVTLTGTAEYASADAGDDIEVTFTPSEVDNDNYTFDTSATITGKGTIAPATATDNTKKTQNVVVEVGTFTKPEIIGVDEKAVSDVALSYDGATTTYDEIVSKLKTLKKGDTATIEYSYKNSNYKPVSGQIAVTIVDIEFTLDDGYITVLENPVYGDTFADIVTWDDSKVTASIDGTEVKGTVKLTPETDDQYPTPRSYSYTLDFVTEDGKTYTITSGTVDIAKKTLTASDFETPASIEKEYDGTTGADAGVTVPAKAASVVNGDEVNLQTTATYDSKDAGSRTVTLTADEITGNGSENYVIAEGLTLTGKGTITPKELSADNFTAPDDITDRVYDGTTSTDVTEAKEVVGLIGDDTVTASGEAAEMDKADAGTNTATLTITKIDNSNYKLPEGGVKLTFNVTVAKASPTVKSSAEQTTPLNDGRFTEPEFIGVNGETVPGTITYSVGEKSGLTYEGAVAELAALDKSGEGESVAVSYTFESSDPNYVFTPSDSDAITLSVVGYEVKDANWTLGGSGTLQITCTGPNDQLDKIEVDGKEVDVETVSGSTIATFKADYLNTLAAGNHTVKFVYQNGEEAEGTLTVKAKPVTSSSSSKTSTTASAAASGVTTCQDAGFPAGYNWNESAKACQLGYEDNNGVWHSTASSRRVGVVNTSDTFGAFSCIVTLGINAVVAVGAAMMLRKWK